MSITHANRGLGAEAVIILANEYYRREGIAVVEKQHTETRLFRKPDGNFGGGKFVRPASCDFIGQVYEIGAIAFEVKSCSQERWALSSIKEHQLAFLADWESCGGTSFILLCHEVAGWRFLKWPNYDLFDNVKSLSLDVMRALPLCEGTAGCPCDYISVLRRIAGR